MAKIKNTAPTPRKNRISVFLNEKEYTILKTNAEMTGFSMSEYIRQLLLGNLPPQKPDEEFYEVMRELSGINNTLTELFYRALSDKSPYGIVIREESRKWRDFQLMVEKRFLSPGKRVLS